MLPCYDIPLPLLSSCNNLALLVRASYYDPLFYLQIHPSFSFVYYEMRRKSYNRRHPADPLGASSFQPLTCSKECKGEEFAHTRCKPSPYCSLKSRREPNGILALPNSKQSQE